MIEKIVTKRRLNDPTAITGDHAYWLSQPAQQRISAVELLRRQYHGDSTRLQRLARVVKRAQSKMVHFLKEGAWCMKDFISKLTFGFLMAQFVPGAIAVCSIAFVYAAFTFDADNSIKSIASMAFSKWGEPLGAKVLFFTMCTAVGMLIHGIHWAVLAYLETCSETDGSRGENRKPAYATFCHGYPVIVQVLLGPIKILLEILGFLFMGKKIESLATHENVPRIHKDKMEAFNFIQEFYLYFAQFYAHTSYALLILFFSAGLFVCFFGLSKIRLCILVGSYILTGLFFVIGRIQLATLFIAEHEMVSENAGQ